LWQLILALYANGLVWVVKRGIDLISDALPFGRLWVRRAERDQQCNRVRDALQPVARRSDSRLR
jgi:hypothetical protein